MRQVQPVGRFDRFWLRAKRTGIQTITHIVTGR